MGAGPSTFAYANGNSLSFIDPLGLCGEEGPVGGEKSGKKEEEGRYEICNKTQQEDGSWMGNKFRMWACKKSIDRACSASHDVDDCCRADFRGCSGGKTPGEPPDTPEQGMKMGKCMVKYVQCMQGKGGGE
ncbi:hypothetical protein DYGSA30_00590 [Dyella sp. GSA-30]|nr:hypothetical protein DYGSA30_00590 [Dyella sp. GSA-30]